MARTVWSRSRSVRSAASPSSRSAGIGRPILKRVPATEVHFVVERLFQAWLEGRTEGERIQQFFTRHSDEELVALGAGEAVAIES